MSIHLKQLCSPLFARAAILFLILSLPALGAEKATQKTLTSPNKQLTLRLNYSHKQDGQSLLTYQISKNQNIVLTESNLSLTLDNHLSEWALAIKNTPPADNWMANLELTGVREWSHDAKWQPVYGERSNIQDHYKAIALEFIQKNNPNYPMILEARIYDAGVAFRYRFPDNPTGIYYRIMQEDTEFSFAPGAQAWHTPWAQGLAEKKPLDNWQVESERPLTIELNNGLYVSLAEAAVVDYVRTKFTLAEDKANTVKTSMFHPMDIVTGTSTPWRVVMVASSAAELLENNDILLNLNEPSRIDNTDWIKPGKIVRDMSLTAKGAMAWIDFAAQHNLQYLLFDWKWYGPAFTFDSDARTVSIELDLPKVIEYGKSKGVGIWLYVNQQALLAQDADIFPLYKKWGLAGVKYGFVQVGSHRWTAWLHDSIERAAKHQLMVNIHDEFRLTGEQRTWPNIVTVEGIRGNEEMPDATNNTVLPFTRGLAGMGDYTICYYDERIKTTHAHQLALSVVMYSPLQTLFWYDSADDSQHEPEIEFFADVPTVWDDTKILDGQIGEFIATVRRSKEEWFLGAITNTQGRNMSIDLDFLTPGKTYQAWIYTDDESVDTRTQVRVSNQSVIAGDQLQFELKPSGGVAIKFSPN